MPSGGAMLTVASLLAPGFIHRAPGGQASAAAAFTAAIQQIPGEIAFVRLGASPSTSHRAAPW
jgi:hypothetical protein